MSRHKPDLRLRHEMWRVDVGTERAGGLCAHGVVAVIAAGGARRQAAGGVQLDVRREVRRELYGVAGLLVLIERKQTGGAVNLFQVVDAGVGLCSGAGAHEVGNRNRRQQAKDGHDDHDFHQREPRPVGGSGRFHGVLYFPCGVNDATDGL